MSNSSYEQYLKSEHWQNVRTKRLDIDGHKCNICNKSNCQLDVHHISYVDYCGDTILFKENPEEDLLTLCHECHAMTHRIKKDLCVLNFTFTTALGLVTNFKDILINSIYVEVFCRDIVNGGDVDLHEQKKLKNIIRVGYLSAFDLAIKNKIIRNTLLELHTKDPLLTKTELLERMFHKFERMFNDDDIVSNVYKIYSLTRAALKIKLYRKTKSLFKVAEIFNVKISSISKIVNRYNFNKGNIK